MAALMLTSCNGSDGLSVAETDALSATGNVAVNIDCMVMGAQAAQTRAGITGSINDEKLKTYGVGVFAYYTGNSTWASAGSGIVPNFMYNQYVEYRAVGLDGEGNDIYGWTYEPLKYWPNDNQPADDVGATGSVEHSYLSFFAYAPYVDVTPSSGNVTGDATSGITAMTANSVAGAPKVTYTWKSGDIKGQVDLLWGTRGKASYDEADGTPSAGTVGTDVNTDLTKQKTNEKVAFLFKHAMASVKIRVQRLYDHTTEANAIVPEAPVIFVSQLKLTPVTDFEPYSTAKLNLTDGTWGDADGKGGVLTYSYDHFNKELSGSTLGNDGNITALRTYELDKIDLYGADAGVNEQQRLLTTDESLLMMIPVLRDGHLKMTPELKYSFVTRDNALELNYLTDSSGNRYSRIVNTVTGDPVDFSSLEAGKQYTILCKIGVESVQFEVAAVEDWDFPIRLDGVTVTDNSTTTIDKTVNEE